MNKKPFYQSKTFWGLALTALGIYAPRYAQFLQGSAGEIVTGVGLLTALYGRWKATKPLGVQEQLAGGGRLMPLIFALPLLASSASAQTFVAGGFQVGGNTVQTRDLSKIGWQVFQPGTRIDKYTFAGGFGEGQYDYPLGHYAALSARALGELTTDPKNLGNGRDGMRYHIRPEAAFTYRLFRQFAAVAQGGVGYTHISNSQYSKSGLNPHVGAGLDFDKKYRFTFDKIFRDTTNLNDNETSGYRYRFDALYPISKKWGAKVGLEHTRYYSIVPGVRDANSVFPCGCLRTKGDALTFRVGLARLFRTKY